MPLLSFDGAPHGGRQRHLPEWQSQPRITPTTIIDHSIVGSAEGAFRHFRDTSNLESHFIVDLDGEIWQLMDTNRQADANLDANRYALSIETADRGDPDNQPWTTEQLDSLAWLHEGLLADHPLIPRRRSRSCADPGGLGYHTLHGAPSCWTPVAKSCPGRVRKVQWADILLPAFLNPEETDDMYDAEAEKRLKTYILETLRLGFAGSKETPIREWAGQLDELKRALTVPGTTTPEETVNLLFERVRNIEDKVEEQEAQLDGIHGKLDVIMAALPDPIAEPPPVP